MAYQNSTKLLLLLLLFYATFLTLHAFKFEVGDEEGWGVPPSKHTQIYNHWASKNRFQIGDTIHFKYKKDSVMEVNEEDYDKCRSSHPTFFSNSGETEVKLDRSGLYYFISGVAGHCERGQKMIIKVISHGEGPGSSPGSSNQTGTPTPPGSDDDWSDAALATPQFLAMASVQLLLVLVSSLFF
ncbi:early nodulin-like protein 21 [Typha angustifolia]|uniref:early nodulin-like protein 21 n=1 Tax=Typha angustifolia TaxID=59011 RepID=UPI003C2D898A